MLGFQTDIFVDAVILLTKCKDDKITDLVNQLIEIYYEDTRTHPENDNALNKNFVELLNKLKKIPNSPTSDVERSSLLIQFLTDPVLQQDNVVFNYIKDIFNTVAPEGIDRPKSEQLQKKLSASILLNKCNKIVRKMFNKLSACNTTLDTEKQEMYLNDSINLARQMIDLTQSTDRLTSGAIERIDISSKESIQKSLNLYKEREVSCKLRTGLQGLNQMLGKRGAFALGECAAFFALNHNYKSGMLMTIARGLVKYNTPQFIPGKGKPLILFITLENEANRDLMWFYEYAYKQTFRKNCDGLTDEEIISFIQDFYSEQGFEFIIERRDGGKYGYDEHVSLIESYESAGYNVVAVLVDYANKMKKGSSGNPSTSQKGNHNLIADLFSNLCTFHKTKGILFITAHQLNRDAQNLVSNVKVNVVKHFGPQFAADSIDVCRELDLEIYMLIERNLSGKKFLTMQRGKHRYVDDTPVAHMYCAYPFEEIDGVNIGIADDINGEPGFVRDIYTCSDDENNNNLDDEFTSVF